MTGADAMTPRVRPARTWRSRLPAALLSAGVLALPGCAVRDSDAAGEPPPQVATAGAPAPAPAAEPAAAPERTPVQGIDPERLRSAAIGVDAPVIDLGLNPDRTLEVPRDFDVTGWWTGGARPGDPGPAVIAGHVDSRTGPAVFFRLGDLQPGDLVEVADAEGRVVSFVVERLEQHPKEAFPTDAVYGPTPQPTLRLVTCGGDFDRASGHYRDNVIVFAAIHSR